jgi:hypothetical protein
MAATGDVKQVCCEVRWRHVEKACKTRCGAARLGSVPGQAELRGCAACAAVLARLQALYHVT